MASRFDTYGKHKKWKGPSSYKKKTTSNKEKTTSNKEGRGKVPLLNKNTRQAYEDKYLNLTKSQKQKNYQKYGNIHGYDPYKESNKIHYTDTTGMDPRDAQRANQAWQKQEDVNEWLQGREDIRNQMKARVKGGDSSLDKDSFREATHGYKDGIFGLNFGGDEILTYDPVKREMVRDKLRLGMSQDDDYYDYFAGEGGLRSLNPQMMDEINPAGSGSFVRNMITKGFGAPSYAAKGLSTLTGPAREKLGDVFSKFKESDFVEDFKGVKDAPGEFINLLNNMGGVNNQFTAPQAVTERYTNPMAGGDRFDDIFQEQEFDEYEIKPFAGMMPQIPETNVNQFGYRGSAAGMNRDSEAFQDMKNMYNFYNQGYEYNQGGIASLNVDFNSDPNYQALKQTNNYMGGF